MGSIIIHVDMDAFFAAVEVRDNPALAGKPLIVGALPSERGVVSTCSYEARGFGVHSAMSIKEAYRLCPHGIYMHPSFHKYKEASDQVHEIWKAYTDVIEYVSLDEGFLDVTGSEHLFGGARNIGREIKRGVKERTGLTCSVGVGYSMMSAKLASEEKKPDGFFEIPDAEALRALIVDRGVRIVYGVGERTALDLQAVGIRTVRDLYANRQLVIRVLGNHGRQILDLADGIDERRVTTYAQAKSVGKEHTFQRDITDFRYLKDVLLLTAKELSFIAHQEKIFCRTVTLKITYGDMRQITRSKSSDATNKAGDIYGAAASMLDKIEKRPVRLAGISLSGFADRPGGQLSMFDDAPDERKEKLDGAAFKLQQRYSRDIIKTGGELGAEKRLLSHDQTPID